MTLLLGVLNLTADSFSDGGEYLEAEAALAHARSMAAAGADVIDVGGESTRPGAQRVDAETEIARVVPIVAALAADGIRVSIDTMRAETARAAVEAGAEIVNDVSGGMADPAMLPYLAESGVLSILSHWRGHSETMDALAEYRDVVAEVRSELADRVAAAQAAGIAADRIILDPGLGFAKRSEHNWAILADLESLAGLGYPLLIGASRKRFLGRLLPEDAVVTERDHETALLSALLGVQGVWGVRVHEVAGNARALRLAEQWRAGLSGAASAAGGLDAGYAGDRPLTRLPVLGAAGGGDRISLTGLRARGRHGVYDFETANGQEFVVDLELWLDLARAARSGELADTVHYGELADQVVQRIEGEPVELLETLAESIAELALGYPAVRAVQVRVHKPEAPIEHPFEDVSVTIHRLQPWRDAVIALGSNLGARRAQLEAAVAALAAHPDIRVQQHSAPWYESPALKTDGVDLEAPAYLNGIALVQTRLSPQALLAVLQEVESAAGRVRQQRWDDRTLDLDLIAMAGVQLDEPGLQLPHPRAHQRAFVLLPWLVLDAAAVLPGHGEVAELLSRSDDALWPASEDTP